jgi:hypothetical protein
VSANYPLTNSDVDAITRRLFRLGSYSGANAGFDPRTRLVSSKQPGSYKLVNGRQIKVDKVNKLSTATRYSVGEVLKMMNEMNDEEFMKAINAPRVQEVHLDSPSR